MRMENKSEFIKKKRSDFGNARNEKFTVRMNKHEIIHVPSVMSYLQVPLYVRIERMEVEVCKNLARKVSDGKSNSFGSREKALIFGKSKPILALSTYNAIPCRIVTENLP